MRGKSVTQTADGVDDTDNDPETPRDRRSERKAPKVISPSARRYLVGAKHRLIPATPAALP